MATPTTAKDLQDTGRQIAKAADGGDPASTLLSLLSPLQKFTATEDLLRQSKIGVAVNKLRQNKDPKVADVASRLINKWKQDVRSSEQRRKGSPAPGSAAAKVNGSNGSVGVDSPKMEGVVKTEKASKRKSKVAPDKRNSKLDEVDTELTDNGARNGCLKLMYDGLAFNSTESPDDIIPVARSIESAAFSSHKQETSASYKAKMRSLYMNLKMKENAELRADVFSGRIEAERFVGMTSEELKSKEKREEEQRLRQENMSKAMTAQEEKAISTTYVSALLTLALMEFCRAIGRPHTSAFSQLHTPPSCESGWSVGSALRSAHCQLFLLSHR